MTKTWSKKLYYRAVGEECRYWLYKLRHPLLFKRLTTQVNVHDKGLFSLKGFKESESIFIHITKSAGTSVATSLYNMLPCHYTAWQYRVILGRRKFNRYFKFSFVRNPWDRLYSAYRFLNAGGWDEKDMAWSKSHLSNVAGFSDFVMNWLTPERLNSHIHFKPQYEFLLDSRGRILVDFLGYYESIEQDFDTIAQRVNSEARLGHKNPSPMGDYRSVYDPRSIARVGELYRRDIEMFGYEFTSFHRKSVFNGQLVD